MAELSIRLNVFIASPGDVAEERDLVEQEISVLSDRYKEFGVRLEPLRWEKGIYPTFERPQDEINKLLKRSDLVIVILGKKLGSAASTFSDETGVQEELRIATQHIVDGLSEDIFLYFKELSAYDLDSSAETKKVYEFRKQLIKTRRYTFDTYDNNDGLKEKVHRHLDMWVKKYVKVRDIFRFAISTSQDDIGQSKELHKLVQKRIYEFSEDNDHINLFLGNYAVEIYQQYGTEAHNITFNLGKNEARTLKRINLILDEEKEDDNLELFRQFGAILPERPVTSSDGKSFGFSHPEWYYYFCAAGLYNAILIDNVRAVDKIPYIHNIHQYLGYLIQKHNDENIVKSLERWLIGNDTTKLKPVARNFAAYVLGMIDSKESKRILAYAVQEDDDETVRFYGSLSLAKLKSRKNLNLLIDNYERAASPHSRIALAQAVCNLLGLTDYQI